MIIGAASVKRYVKISEPVWRQAAHSHQQRIRTLLSPGLLSRDNPLNSGKNRQRRFNPTENKDEKELEWVTALDPQHPVYNFLIEYYGIKGTKGVRRLTRWAPSPTLLLHDHCVTINSIEQLDSLSHLNNTADSPTQPSVPPLDGIVLEGARKSDFANILLRRGSLVADNERHVIYSPSLYFSRGNPNQVEKAKSAMAGFLWYQFLLQETISRDPILHCFGLHEWAMQYRPDGAPQPPSSKYQAHLSLRVPQNIINETVERRGVTCSHVDALKYFAPDALPLNSFGGPLGRDDQSRLEQPACVHAHMDLLKMTLKLQPFCDTALLRTVLEVALEARRLDVSASPYDASYYGLEAVPIETAEGRGEYRAKQLALLNKVQPVRKDVLQAYETLINLAFDKELLNVTPKSAQE